ncbi:acyltransferase [Rhizobium sp. PRIMUS64]|uniref:acyltransferase family protein n=1 Tax=Rhizobium sp. PRIMUS64 TaxID=2908925 RepID=UPI001FF510D0|nr:acyltransferase [Rhizobium sp. PRIMUS64]MCJ9696918.1 acyltransferase [Rhizobium sp. PRIMUS64]
MLQHYDIGKETAVIDALRGIAALLVLLSHADAYSLIRFEPIVPYSGYFGAIGVCVFFILSGYLIWASAGRQFEKVDGIRIYAVHRAARIMPLYFVALAFAVLIFPRISEFPVEVTAHNVWRHITFTQALIPDVSRTLNPVLWTLTFEMIFYIAAPFLYALRRFFPAFMVIAAVTLVLGHIFPSPYFKYRNLLPLFVVGMSLAQYRLAPTWVCAVVSAVAAIAVGLMGAKALLISAVWAVAIVSAAIALRDYRSSLAMRAFGFVGVCSFSLYIWHYMLIEIVGPFLMRQGSIPLVYPVLTGICFTAFCLAFSWASYRLIERPAQAAIREIFSRKTAAVAR